MKTIEQIGGPENTQAQQELGELVTCLREQKAELEMAVDREVADALFRVA